MNFLISELLISRNLVLSHYLPRFLHHPTTWLALGFATPKSLWELQALGARVDELTATGSRLASEITHAEVIIWLDGWTVGNPDWYSYISPTFSFFQDVFSQFFFVYPIFLKMRSLRRKWSFCFRYQMIFSMCLSNSTSNLLDVLLFLPATFRRRCPAM